MADPFSSDKLKAIAQSVLLRCEYLSTMFGSDAPGEARTGLVSLNRAIYLLATRYLGDPVEPYVLRPDIRANRAHIWYEQYLKALINVSQVVQGALADGRVTPRCLLSRAPFPRDALTEWTALDIGGAVSAAARTFWGSPPNDGFDSPAWPDYAARAPGVGIDRSELVERLEKMGFESSLRNDAAGKLSDASRDGIERFSAHAPAAAMLVLNVIDIVPSVQKETSPSAVANAPAASADECPPGAVSGKHGAVLLTTNGPNSKAAMDTHIDHRAREIYREGKVTTLEPIAIQIASELELSGFKGPGGAFLSAETVRKAIPTGLTGGRKKNGKAKRF